MTTTPIPELGRRARALGARTVRSEEFLAEVRKVLEKGGAPEKPEKPSAGEVEEWLELFGGDR